MTINETTNYKIKKPTPDEYYDIALNNDNADIIDGAIKINADAIATKQAIITGGASTIASANLPFKKAVVTDSTGKITVADVTDLELGYVKGVTGALQTQINTKASASGLNSHTGDAVAHITAGERSAWNALPTDANFTAHVTDSVKHITGTERTAWNAKTDDTALNSHKSDSVHIQTGERTKWNNKTDDTTVDAHVLDTGRHVTAGDKTNWNRKTDNTALNSHKGDSTHITGAERILWTGKTDDTVVNSHAGNGDIHVTKALKAGWTAKADVSDITGAVSTHAGLNTHITEDERTAWNALPTDANFTAHVTDSVKHITGTERTAWNAKETPSGAQSKATTALTDAKSYVDGKVKTDVPVNAKFTDTNTVTSINGKTGVIAKADIVALGIPAQDTVVNISGKVDVEAGKGLSTNDYTTVEKNKLAGVDTGANKYIHPTSHPASIITESTTKRFVTDAEKTAWNAKTTDANLIIHEADAVKHITSGERATWNNKVNISTGGVHKNKFVQTDADGNIKKFDTIQSADVPVHSAGLLTSGTIPSGRIGLDIGRASDLTTHAGLSTHISSTERTKWNKVTDKADTSAMNSALETKADTTALNAHTIDKDNPHSVTKAQVGLGNVNNTSDAAKPISTATQTALNSKVDVVGRKNIALEPAGVWGLGVDVKHRDAVYNPAETVRMRVDEVRDVNGAPVTILETSVIPDTTTHSISLYRGAGTSSHFRFRLLDNGDSYMAIPMRSSPTVGEAVNVGYVIDQVAGMVNYVDGEVGTHEARKDNPHGVTKAQVGLGAYPTSPADIGISTATQTALDGTVKKTELDNSFADVNRIVGVNDGWRRCSNYNVTNFVSVTCAGQNMRVAISRDGGATSTEVCNKIVSLDYRDIGSTSHSFIVPKDWHYRVNNTRDDTDTVVEQPITL